MTNAELIAQLQRYPLDMPVCVTTDARRETLEAGTVEVMPYSEEEGGPVLVVTGLEDLAGIFGERR